MSTHKETEDTNISVEPKRKRGILAKAGIIVACSVAGIIFLVVAATCALTWYLTPSRLSGIINREASKYLYADVEVKNPTFTIWSTFPDLHIKADSLHINSTVFNNVSVADRKNFPDNAAFLISSGEIDTDIDIMRLIKGEIAIGNIHVSGVDLNLVQLSDSLSNFNIVKKKVEKMQIPEFSAREIILTSPAKVTYLNIPEDLSVKAYISKMSVDAANENKNTYSTDFAGKISLVRNGQKILSEFPVSLKGKTILGFNPFSLKLSESNIALANMNAEVNTQVTTGKNVTVDNMSCRIKEFNADSLLSYLPVNLFSLPEAIDTDVRLNGNMKLSSPYTITSGSKGTIPSFTADLTVAEGEVIIKDRNGKPNKLDHGNITARLMIDGKHTENSYLEVPRFNVSGDATDMSLQAYVADIFKDPEVRVAVSGNTDIALAGNVIKPLRQFKAAGKLTSDAIVRFHLSNIERADLKNVNLKGDIDLSNYSFLIPQNGMKASGDKIALNFGTTAKDLSADIVDNGKMDINMKAGNILLTGNDLKADIRGLQLTGNVTRENINAPQMFHIKITGDYAGASKGKEKINAQNFEAVFDATKLAKRIKPAIYVMPSEWTADDASISFVGHTSEYITATVPENIRSLFSQWKTHLLVKIKTGEFLTPALPLHNGYGNLLLEASLDSLNLKHLDFNSQDTRMHLNASVSNLRQFLTSGRIAPLRMAADVAIDTVQINQLAGAYNHGLQITHGPKASVLTVIPDTLTPGDTLSLLIPRNIIADIKASAMMTKYTNLEMHDLATQLIVKDGRLQVKDLGIDTGFGALKMNFAYDTSDIQHIGMDMQMGLAEVDLVDFFSNFHTLLLMMPQMRNITGDLSALAEAKLLLFPNMYFNMPSIWADLYVHGENLSLHQDSFIRRITRMMLIRDKGDIKLADMDIHASVHDNLMELYPFDISFDKYRLQFGGLNNFDGEMYYHLGINKSPVPFPFGINIKGDIKHPEIRFGGAAYKVDQGEEISSSVMEEKKINLPLQLKCLVREMIAKAAEADTTPASFYTY